MQYYWYIYNCDHLHTGTPVCHQVAALSYLHWSSRSSSCFFGARENYTKFSRVMHHSPEGPSWSGLCSPCIGHSQTSLTLELFAKGEQCCPLLWKGKMDQPNPVKLCVQRLGELWKILKASLLNWVIFLRPAWRLGMWRSVTAPSRRSSNCSSTWKL